jgi:hypothetical protein
VNALAIVGFVVLIILGMALAVYAATFVPKAVTRLGGAAVYLSSLFVPVETPAKLEVVAPGTVVPFPDAPATVSTSTPVVVTPIQPAQAPGAVVTTPGAHTTTTYPVGTVPAQPAALFGLPDLTVSVVATGYLTSADTSSFIKSDTVPEGLRGAVKFTIVNIGTNASGRFDFEATLPTTRAYTFTSDYQSSLLPGEKVEYVLGFDRTRSGDERTITISVDENTKVRESNESNNSDSKNVTIK